MVALINVILWLVLALCPLVGYFCFRTKQRAWITLIVIVMIIDIVVLMRVVNF